MCKNRGHFLIGAALALTSLLVACGGGHVVPRSPGAAKTSTMPRSASVSQSSVPNLFAQAVGKNLSPSDIDQYIASSVQGNDRSKLRNLMELLPPNMRGDVVYYDGARAISNNPAVLPNIQILPPKAATASAAAVRMGQMTSQARRSMTAGYCSPPDPYYGSGPYVREVGNCGFTSGWGIVNLECNSSHFYSNVDGFPNYQDNKEGGYMYFELTNSYTSPSMLSEGGIFTQYGVYGEYDIDPYITSNLGTLNNNGARYTCGTYIGVMSGLVYTAPGSQPYYYVAAGTISGYNPSYAWQSTETVTMSNAAWIFEPAPGTGYQWGINSVGLDAPCMQCAITKITSIADKGGTDIWDNSYFGVDPSTGQNAVYWPEIVFGVWSGCVSGGTSPPSNCTLKYSPDSSKWYAGPEIYPQPVGTAEPDAQSSFFQANGGWVYQSYDSVTAAFPSIGPGVLRRPAGAFPAPTPGPICTADSSGLCAVNTTNENLQRCYVEVWDSMLQDYVPRPRPYYSQSVYAVYRSTSLQSLATRTITKDQDGCAITSTSWSPAEPRVTYNDPYLP